MSRVIVVTGTDTDVGKTVFSAGLTRFVDGAYWKPIQAGLEGRTDSETVHRLSALPADRIFPERYRLKTPASPHLAAALDGIQIDPDSLMIPQSSRPLIVEGAGGVMVPLRPDMLYIDLFARWRQPTVLVARTSLGTINHTLLSIEALRSRRVPILGVAFVGDAHAENEQIINSMGRIRILGRLPRLDPLTSEALGAAFEHAFARDAFLETETVA